MKFNPFSLVFGTPKSEHPLLAFGMDFALDAMAHAGVNAQTATVAVQRTQVHTLSRIDSALEHHIATDVTIAPVKSAWFSSINWVALPTAVVSILAMFGIIVPSNVQDAGVHVYQGVVGAVCLFIFVKRTWFTHSLTSASVQGEMK